MSWLFVVVALLVLITVLPILSAFKISSIKLMSGSINTIEPSVVPPEQVDILIEAEKFFVKLGFDRQAHVTRGPVINGHDWGLFGVVFHHANTNTWALVYVEPSGYQALPWKCIFITNVEGKTLATVNAEDNETDLSELGFVIHDPLVCSTSEQWQSHRKSLKEYTSIQKSDLKDILIAFEIVYFQGLVETNTVVPYKGGYRYTLRDSLNISKRYNYIQKTLGSQNKQSNNEATSETKVTTSVQREVTAYQAFKNMQDNNQTGWMGKTIFLLVSVVLFGVSFGVALSWENLILLIVVLFIHEVGHLFGMWIFGYKDLRMLFIPFLGALASGKKENVTAWQESIVLLLGPMPGYVIGIAILFGGGDELPVWLIQYAIISIILNALNLLPFVPLDGGRIVSLALFNRLPSLQLLLMILSVFGFLYAGVFLGEWVLMILVFLLIVGMPALWREIQLFKHLLQQKLHEQPFDTKLLIETLYNHALWKGISLPNKWPLVDSLSYRVQHANAGFSVRASIFGLWLAVIIVPMYVVLPNGSLSALSAVTFSDQYSLSVEDTIENYNEANSETERAKFAIEISSWLAGEEDRARRLYWNKAKEHISSNDILNSDKSQYYSQISALCSDYEPEGCEREYLKKGLYYLELDDSKENKLLIPFLSRLAELESGSLDESLKHINKALAKVAEEPSLQYWKPSLTLQKAKIYYANSQMSKAEAILVEGVESSFVQNFEISTFYQKELLNFYYAIGRKDRAVKAVKAWIEDEKYFFISGGSLYEQFLYVAVWVLIDTDPNQALKALEKIETSTTVDKIEINLAKILAAEAAGNETLDNRETIQSFVSEVNEEYEWISMYLYVEEKPTQIEDEWFSLDNSWNQRIGELLKREEFRFILEKIRKIHDR